MDEFDVDHADLTAKLGDLLNGVRGNPDLGGGLDVRLQVHENGGGWEIHTGDAQYDTDHTGYWGAGFLAADTNPADLARELISEAEESWATVNG